MHTNFEYMTALQYRNKVLKSQLEAYESGDIYKKMTSDHKILLSKKDREISKLKSELAKAHSEIITVRKYWTEIFDDLDKEHEKVLLEKNRIIHALEGKLLRMAQQRDSALDKIKEKTQELYEVKTELEEEKGKNMKLTAQINRDFENSSIPSSLKPNHKKIKNNREKTERKPGGQPGHKGHERKKHIATTPIHHIPVPDKYLNILEYRPTGRMITKQKISIKVSVIVEEYVTPEFRNLKTGQRVHATFPDGVINEVNYDGSVKAFLFLLNNHCCVSIDKSREFLTQLTDGKLTISKGTINGLCKEFSKKTEVEQKDAFTKMLGSPVINTDFTNARIDGKSAQVLVCATPETVLYFAREHKGHKGIEGTPIELYRGILVHDHDITFYNYGEDHQECIVHVLRYLKDSIENEPLLTWNKKMHVLFQEMIHYRNSLGEQENLDSEKVDDFESRYRAALEIANDEYEYEPPSNYYKDGYNLFKRLKNYEKNHVLFLHDKRVSADNNLSERLNRNYKRKQKQVMTFRSYGGFENLCNCMGMIASLCKQEKNMYMSVADIFNKKIPCQI